MGWWKEVWYTGVKKEVKTNKRGREKRILCGRQGKKMRRKKKEGKNGTSNQRKGRGRNMGGSGGIRRKKK